MPSTTRPSTRSGSPPWMARATSTPATPGAAPRPTPASAPRRTPCRIRATACSSSRPTSGRPSPAAIRAMPPPRPHAPAPPRRVPWSAGPQPPPQGGFNQQNGIAVSPMTRATGGADGLYVIDTFEQRVQKFDTTKTCGSARPLPRLGSASGAHGRPTPEIAGLRLSARTHRGPDGGRIWVGDNNNDVLAFNPDGSFVHRSAPRESAAAMFSGGVQGIDVAGRTGLRHRRGRLPPAGVRRGPVAVGADGIANAPAGTLLESLGTCGNGCRPDEAAARRGGRLIQRSTAYVVEHPDAIPDAAIWSPSQLQHRRTPPRNRTVAARRWPQPWGITWDPARTWLYIGDVRTSASCAGIPVSGRPCQAVVHDLPRCPPGYYHGRHVGSNFLAFGATRSAGCTATQRQQPPHLRLHDHRLKDRLGDR